MDLTLSDDHKSGSTVPSLPAELVLHIIRLSLPSRPGERSAWNARVAVLCACALVNSTWRALAERELYRSIEVWNETAGKLLCRTMGKRGGRGKQLAGLCTDMAVASHWSGCHSFADSNRLGELLGLGTQLVELKLCSIWDVDGWAVLKCPNLRFASLAECTITVSIGTSRPSSPSPLSFLGLVNTTIVPGALPPQLLPRLTRLALVNCDKFNVAGLRPSSRDNRDLLVAIEPLVGRIKSLRVDEVSAELVRLVLPMCRSLGTLALSDVDWDYLHECLAGAPSPVRRLYLSQPDRLADLCGAERETVADEVWRRDAAVILELFEMSPRPPSILDLTTIRLSGAPHPAGATAAVTRRLVAQIDFLGTQRNIEIMWGTRLASGASQSPYVRFEEEMERRDQA